MTASDAPDGHPRWRCSVCSDRPPGLQPPAGELSRDEWGDVLDTLTDMVTVHDRRHRIIAANRAAREALGLGDVLMPSHHCYRRFHGAPQPPAGCPSCRSLRTGKPDVSEYYEPHLGRHLEIRAIPRTTPDGEVFGVVHVVRDVTDQRRAERELELLTRQQAAERATSDFVSVASHELRTPLTSVVGSLGLLEGEVGGELPPRAHQLVAIAQRNAERLLRLVNELLDVEKLHAGKAELRLVDLRPAELVDAALGGVQFLAERASVRLQRLTTYAGTFRGDRDRLLQVLTNLLANAIRFSPEGGLVEVRACAAPAGRLRFEVADQGPGIPRAEQGRLFERFGQLRQAERFPRGGSGLGLAIARALVEQHGGTIGVDSDEGAGALFFFELPAGGAAAAAPRP